MIDVLLSFSLQFCLWFPHSSGLLRWALIDSVAVRLELDKERRFIFQAFRSEAGSGVAVDSDTGRAFATTAGVLRLTISLGNTRRLGGAKQF